MCSTEVKTGEWRPMQVNVKTVKTFFKRESEDDNNDTGNLAV